MRKYILFWLLLTNSIIYADQDVLENFPNHDWEMSVFKNWSEKTVYFFFLNFEDDNIVVVSRYDLKMKLEWQKQFNYSVNGERFYIYLDLIEQPYLIIDYEAGQLSAKSPASIHFDFISINRIKDEYANNTIMGRLNDSNVRIRIAPTLDSMQIGLLKKDEIVTITNSTDNQMLISDMESVWYKIVTKDGIIGWSYGYFIDVID